MSIALKKQPFFILFFLFFISINGVCEDPFRYYTSLLQIEPITPPASISNFKLTLLDGNTISLRDFQNKIVFLNFFATWCAPCRTEMPSMQKLFHHFAHDPFTIIGISTDTGDDAQAKVKRYIDSLTITFPVAIDTSLSIAKECDAYSLPYTIIINKKGDMIGKFIGARNWTSGNMKNFVSYLINNDIAISPKPKEKSLYAQLIDFELPTKGRSREGNFTLKIQVTNFDDTVSIQSPIINGTQNIEILSLNESAHVTKNSHDDIIFEKILTYSFKLDPEKNGLIESILIPYKLSAEEPVSYFTVKTISLEYKKSYLRPLVIGFIFILFILGSIFLLKIKRDKENIRFN